MNLWTYHPQKAKWAFHSHPIPERMHLKRSLEKGSYPFESCQCDWMHRAYTAEHATKSVIQPDAVHTIAILILSLRRGKDKKIKKNEANI